MENREFDIFTDTLANKDMTLQQFAEIGMKASNTSLQSKDKYKNNEWVKEQFSDPLGNFNENEFNTFYDNAKLYYNRLALLDLSTNLTDEPIWHRDNIFVSPEKTNKGPEFKDIRVSNPYQITANLIQLGETGDRTKSLDELALENKVLLNPKEAEKDPSKAKWGEDPNHNFWGYFDDTLVLAQYEEDGTHTDPITGETVSHTKGDPKLNSEGSFYYEKLDGRDIHDKRVLNKMNVLTVDGSWANRHLDFFDSDDLNLKSAGGAILKNAALVGSMFLPYVGPWVIGASIASLMVGLLGTIGKMAMGSDNSVFNEMEGWSKSMSRQASSEYSQQHMLSTENLINLVGDTVALLAEQRFIFKLLPAVLGKTNITTESGVAKKTAQLEAEQTALNNTKIGEILSSGDGKKLKNITEYLRNDKALKAEINRSLDDYTKGYYKIGEVLSKGYMTAITVADTYGDAKAAGASDLEATLLTLGHAMGEYAILNTGLGELILPELRTSARRQEAIANGLTKMARESFAKLEGNTSLVARHAYALKLFNFGKEIALGKYVTGSKTLLSVGAAALGESFEEVSEELLSDFSKACYDAVKWLQGDSTRINTFGYDFKTGEFDIQEVAARYGMNALGGFIGGGIANAATDFRSMKALDKLTPESTIQLLIYMDRNGEMKDFLKNVDKMNLGNKYLSTKFTTKEDGTKVYDVGTELDNLDKFIKDALKYQAQMVHEILHANGADISDNLFISKNTFEDLRFNALLKSATADNYISQFNTKVSEVVRLTNELNDYKLSMVDTNKDGVAEDREKRNAKKEEKPEVSELSEKNLKDLEKLLKDALKELLELTDGSKSYDFISEALFEMTDELSGVFGEINFLDFAQRRSGMKYSDIPDKQMLKIRKEYEKFREYGLKERISYIASVFRAINENSSSVILKHGQEYDNLDKEINEINHVINTLNFVFTKPELDVEGFLKEALKIASKDDNFYKFLEHIVGTFGTDEEKLQLVDIESRPLVGTELELETQETKKYREMSKLSTEVMVRTIQDFVNPIINRGYVGQEARYRLVNFLNEFANQINTQRVIAEEGKSVTEIAEIRAIYNKALDIAILSRNKIEELPNTPFELGYNEFAVSIGAKQYNITLLISELNKRLSETSEDVSKFKLDEDLSIALNSSILTLRMYRAAIMAARTDSEATNAQNVFGYNATLNEVASKMKVEHPQLAEIDSKLADKMVVDIDVNLQKLLSLKRLLNVNNGQKLTQLDRVAATRDILTFKLMRTLVGVKDDDELRKWKNFGEFELAINSLSTLTSLDTDKLKTNLSEEEKKKVQTEIIKMDNAFYKLMQDNFGDFTKITEDDISKLKLLINPDRFALYSNADELLNENLTALDGNSFIWTLASRAALRSSDFYKAYAQVINPEAENPIAPISPLEMAIFTDYAHIVNGNVFSAFAKAYRASIIDDFNSKPPSKLIEILLKLGFDPNTSQLLTTEEWKKYIINNLPVPKYDNIVLTEGIPGAGKTKGTFVVLVDILKKYHKDTALKNVWVVHGVGLKNAEDLVNDIGLEIGDNTRAFGRDGLMHEIDPTWTEYEKDPITGIYIVKDSDYTVNEEGFFVSSRPINPKPTNPPSLIVIDEVTHFNSYDLDLIQKYARQHGITVIVAGDYDLCGVTGTHNVKEVSGGVWHLETKRTSFIRSPKLGVSMRTDNSLKTVNLQKFLEYMHHPSGSLTLNYYEGEDGIYGDKLFEFNEEGDYDPVNHREDIFDNVMESIERMKNTLKKDANGKTLKIGYIYNDTNSLIYKELSKPEWEPYVELKAGYNALGSESLYYIIDINPYKYNEDSDDWDESMSLEEYKKLLYTGITRSEQGSLIIAPSNYQGFELSLLFNSYKISEPKNSNLIKKYATKRKELLTELTEDGQDIKIVERSDKGTSEELAANPGVEKGLKDGVEQPDDSEDSAPTYNPPAQIDNNASEEELKKLAELLLAENPTNVGDVLTILMVWGDERDTYEKTVQEITDTEVIYTDGTKDDKAILLSEFGLPYKKDDATYTIIKHSARVTEQPTDPANPLEEKTIITDDDVKSDKDVAEEVDSTNESDPESAVDATGKITMLLHTHNTFETGVVWLQDSDPDADPNAYEWDEYNEARIDSLNGLIKLGRLIGKFKDCSKEKYLEHLGEIRSRLLNIKDKKELERKLASYLGIPKAYITFAYKSTPRPGEGNKASGREHVSEDEKYFGLEKSTREHTEFNGSTNPENSEWHNKSLVAIINNGDKDVLEIPLAAFTSPWTLMQTKTRNDKGEFEYNFKEVVDKFNKYKKEGLDMHQISLKLLEDFKDDKREEYRELMDLFELYDFTDGGVFYIGDNDWTLALNCELVGPTFSKTRGYYYAEDSKKRYDWNEQTEAEWVSLSDFAKRKNATVSKGVYTSTTGRMSGVRHRVFKKGHSFVLYSNDLSLDSDRALFELYKAQEMAKEQGKPYENKVILLYVMAPQASFLEYIENLSRILNDKKSKDAEHIGQPYTAYKIFKLLAGNPRFLESLEKRIPGITPKLKETVTRLMKIEDKPEEFKEAMYELTVWEGFNTADKPMRLFNLFNGVLIDACYTYREITKKVGKHINQDMVDEITLILKENNVNGIRRRLPITKGSNTLGDLVLVNLEPGYKIDGKSVKIHGKVDSYIFKAKMGGLIRSWLSTKKYTDGRGHVHSHDTKAYIEGQSRLIAKSGSDKPAPDPNARRIKQLLNKTGVDYTDFFKKNNLDIALKAICDHINMSGKHIAVIVNNEIIVNDIPGYRATFRIDNALPVYDITSTRDNNGIYHFLLDLEDINTGEVKHFNAEMDEKGNITRSEIVPQKDDLKDDTPKDDGLPEVTYITIDGVTPETFDDWLKKISHLPILTGEFAFVQWLVSNSNSFEELTNALNLKIPYSSPKAVTLKLNSFKKKATDPDDIEVIDKLLKLVDNYEQNRDNPTCKLNIKTVS